MMLTRSLTPQYSAGLPLPVPIAHHVPVSSNLAVTATPTLNLPGEMVMADPSQPTTYAWPLVWSQTDYGHFGSTRPYVNRR